MLKPIDYVLISQRKLVLGTNVLLYTRIENTCTLLSLHHKEYANIYQNYKYSVNIPD